MAKSNAGGNRGAMMKVSNKAGSGPQARKTSGSPAKMVKAAMAGAQRQVRALDPGVFKRS